MALPKTKTTLREGVINIPGGVYRFGAIRAPDAVPPIFGRSHLDPPQNSVTQCTPPQIAFLEENFLNCPQKKQNISKFTL